MRVACIFPIILYLNQGMEPIIQANNLYRYYGKQCAVEDVSFSLEPGQVLGFLGPNGAGKSTTMQMICGILAASSGQIRIGGFDILEHPKQAKENLGYLPDTPPIYIDSTVNEFLNYCARLRGVAANRVKLCVDAAKDRCGLSEVSKRLIGNLSKGYQQRIGIAQAILHSPSVIVLDEPTVGLDPIQIREIRNLILELGRQHAIILSTHILSEVQSTCTHVQIIHQGKLVLNDTTRNLEKKMQASSLLLSTRQTPQPNLLEQVPGVVEIDCIDKNTFRIYFQKTLNPSEQLADVIVAAGLGLLQLSPEHRSIEEIFVEHTQSAANEEVEFA